MHMYIYIYTCVCIYTVYTSFLDTTSRVSHGLALDRLDGPSESLFNGGAANGGLVTDLHGVCWIFTVLHMQLLGVNTSTVTQVVRPCVFTYIYICIYICMIVCVSACVSV